MRIQSHLKAVLWNKPSLLRVPRLRATSGDKPSHAGAVGLAGLVGLLGIAPVMGAPWAAAATKEDSGWVSLFNGKNLDGFFAYFQDSGVVDIGKQDAFLVEDGMIHVPKAHAGGYTNMEGHLITKQEYSWYRVRVDYRYSPNPESQNAGLVIHIDNRDALVGGQKALRPRSIEINMRRGESSQWTLWSATNLGPYISTTVKPGTADFLSKDKGGVDWTNDPWGSRTIRTTLPQSENPMGEWNHGEALVYGDSMVVCTLNGQLRTRGWGFRLRGSPNDPSPGKRVPCDHGGIGIQSEIQEIWYRNLEIMELEPHTLKPLHAAPTLAGQHRRRGFPDTAATAFPKRKYSADGKHLPIPSRCTTQSLEARQ
jgi:hypothetical protein